MSALQWILIAAIALPALGLALWPVLSGRGANRAAASRAVPPGDRRLELAENKAGIYRALRELEFDHEAGHLSDDDYQSLRGRYEARAAEVLTALDALGPAPAGPAPRPGERERRTPGAPASKGWTRHPATLVAGALGLLVFGVVLGAGVSRFSEQSEPMAPPAGGPPASNPPPVIPGPMAGAEPGKPLPAEVLRGMLGAARQSLTEGRYSEAIAAYQAVLKREPKNVDALTHLGLIVAIGGHADAALETFDKALAIDPRYAPAHLYRGEVLYEVKQDYPGAVRAWERYLELEPSGPERNRIVALVKEARSKPKPR